jgi:hypothetical protein
MSTALTTYIPQTPAIPIETEVSAETPAEMMAAQVNLIAWCDAKIGALRHEQTELQAAFEHAVAHKWKASTLKRHADIASKRIDYYQKVKLALEAGYVIVPNFPVRIFAIRTDRTKPLKVLKQVQWDQHEQHAHGLPQGEGEYKNPLPVVYESGEYVVKREGQPDKKVKDYWAEKWDDFEFPLNMSRVRIMEAATRAMALSVFDELGILPNDRRTPDPIITGRVVDPRSTKFNRRVLTFMVAWHIDTRTL